MNDSTRAAGAQPGSTFNELRISNWDSRHLKIGGHRNFGYGKRLWWAGKNALHDRYGDDKGAANSYEVVVPAIAIECKRYLERNKLDECSGTAEKAKRATPYCKYYVVSEYLKMDNAAPELSLIDEIYVLRKQRNSDRLADNFIPNPISADLVWDLYRRCVEHLKRVWWDPESVISNGKVFNFE